MTSRDFCFWLQGFFEIANCHKPDSELELSSAQVKMIERHLSLVFKHEIDPSMGDEKVQAELNKIHSSMTPRC